MNFLERFAGRRCGDHLWEFQLATEVNGGFGGTNGGVLAAICINVARSLAPGKTPVGLDARFLNGFRPGLATIKAMTLSAGRTMNVVSIDILDEQQRPATRGTVSLVNTASLAGISGDFADRPERELLSYTDGKVWREPPTQPIPLIETFKPRYLGKDNFGISTAVDIIWNEPDTLAEACCIAADISVGPPVARAMKRQPLSIPNPDLSLRFTGAELSPSWLLSTCKLASLNIGIAATSLEVTSGNTLLAVGVSTTICTGKL